MLDPAIVGGILLVIGAFLTMQGKIFKAVIVYFVADCCWTLLAFQAGNIIGATFILIGMLLGLFAFFKMRTGKMRKNLDL